MTDRKPTLNEVANELNRRIKANEIEAEDAEILSAHLATEMKGWIADMGVDIETLRQLAGISRISPITPIKPIVPMEILPTPIKSYDSLRDEFSIASRAAGFSFSGYGVSGILSDGISDKKPPPQSAPPMSLADTAVTSGDPYRTAGKRTIEDALSEAGIGYKVFIKLDFNDWDPEPLTDEQRVFLDKLSDENPRIEFLFELPTRVIASPPGFFHRMWRRMVGKHPVIRSLPCNCQPCDCQFFCEKLTKENKNG